MGGPAGLAVYGYFLILLGGITVIQVTSGHRLKLRIQPTEMNLAQVNDPCNPAPTPVSKDSNLKLPPGYPSNWPDPWHLTRIHLYTSASVNQIMQTLLSAKLLGFPSKTIGDVFSAFSSENCAVFPTGGIIRDSLRRVQAADVDAETYCDIAVTLKICQQIFGQGNCKQTGATLAISGTDGTSGFEFELSGMSNGFFGNPVNLEYAVNGLSYEYTNKVIYSFTEWGVQDACSQLIRIPVPESEWDQWRDSDQPNVYNKKVFRYWKLRCNGFEPVNSETQSYIVTNAWNTLNGFSRQNFWPICKYISKGDQGKLTSGLSGWDGRCMIANMSVVDTRIKVFYDDIMTGKDASLWRNTICQKIANLMWLVSGSNKFYTADYYCGETLHPCDSDSWIAWNGYCYYSGTDAIPQKITWVNAEQLCMAKSAHLVSLHSAEERMTAETMNGCEPNWIGLAMTGNFDVYWWKDLTKWTWTDVSPGNWDFAGEYDIGDTEKCDHYNAGYWCAALSWGTDKPDTWSNHFCAYMDTAYYTCKKEASLSIALWSQLSPDATHCTSGWRYWNKRCYKFVNVLVTPDTAQSRCRDNEQGSLVDARSFATADLTFLRSLRTSCLYTWVSPCSLFKATALPAFGRPTEQQSCSYQYSYICVKDSQ